MSEQNKCYCTNKGRCFNCMLEDNRKLEESIKKDGFTKFAQDNTFLHEFAIHARKIPNNVCPNFVAFDDHLRL